LLGFALKVSKKEKLSNTNKIMLLEVCVIPSPVVTQAVASSGVDTIVIDQEHSAISSDKLHSMTAVDWSNFGQFVYDEIKNDTC